jgi:hypothetical protein
MYIAATFVWIKKKLYKTHKIGVDYNKTKIWQLKVLFVFTNVYMWLAINNTDLYMYLQKCKKNAYISLCKYTIS